MQYKSNLEAPDMGGYFSHMHSRTMPHSTLHDVPSDWADKSDDDPVFGLHKQCGFWLHDEAAILYNVAKLVGGNWLDIGAHTGWTAMHIAAAGCRVMALDPMLQVPEFEMRFNKNTEPWLHRIRTFDWTSNHFFERLGSAAEPRQYDGIVIDGDHESPFPLQDAKHAAAHLKDNGVILFHDAILTQVQAGIEWLIGQGFKCKIYSTPQGVALLWRGDFEPPAHVPDPRVEAVTRQCLNGLDRYAA